MKISQETLDAISASELAAQNAGKAGIKAIIAMLTDYDIRPAKHGDAKALSDLLKAAGVKMAACKRYAEITVMTSATIHHRATMARSKVKSVEKAETEKKSVLVDMEKLEGMTDMRKVRQWAKENGPKAKKPAPAPVEDPAPAPAPVEDPAPAPASIEAIGQIREIRETLAMINAGQVMPGEALATIAGIVGIALASPAKTAKTRANSKASKPQAA